MYHKMIHQISSCVFEKHILPHLSDTNIVSLRGTCETLKPLCDRRFIKIQYRQMSNIIVTQENYIENLTFENLDSLQKIASTQCENNRFQKENQELCRKIDRLDSAIQKWAPHILVESKNTTKPYYSGTQNGPVENFKQWLIHEKSIDSETISKRSNRILDTLKKKYQFHPNFYNATAPWFRYIDLHLDSPNANRYGNELAYFNKL